MGQALQVVLLGNLFGESFLFLNTFWKHVTKRNFLTNKTQNIFQTTKDNTFQSSIIIEENPYILIYRRLMLNRNGLRLSFNY